MQGIDIKASTISMPAELQTLFTRNKKNNTFFETLSFSNKKEYIVWINNDKKGETKQASLEAAIEKLATGKRNPSDK